MKAYTLSAPAKINLYLEIIGDRPDGYHELVMILQSIALADIIKLRSNGTENIRLFCDCPQVPLDASNIAYRAAELMREEFPKIAANYGGVDIEIAKKIPVAAGLAGGSANGAAVLVGLDLMWELGLTVPELQLLAAKLGSDVPFCISGGTAIATARGEKIDALIDLRNLWVILAKYDSLAVSTAWAYKTYKQSFGNSYIVDPEGIKSRTAQVHSGALVDAIARQDSAKIGQLLHNDLEKVVLPQLPQVKQLKDTFRSMDCLGTMMSGSGSTVFALYDSYEKAETAKRKMKETISHPDLQLWVAQLSSAGVKVISIGK
jgi:4-diphosphocytidyl-2-C-methyl-D-erythritol kinase